MKTNISPPQPCNTIYWCGVAFDPRGRSENLYTFLVAPLCLASQLMFVAHDVTAEEVGQLMGGN